MPPPPPRPPRSPRPPPPPPPRARAPDTVAHLPPLALPAGLRLVKHMAGNSSKGRGLKDMVRFEFRKNMAETNPETVANLKTK